MSDEEHNGHFTDDQRRILAGVLDEIIPSRPDGRLPGAGTLGVGDFVERALHGTPALRAMIAESLAALDDLARRQKSQGFAALDAADRAQVLNALAATEHGFPPVLLLHAFAGYYQTPRVLEALGLEPRPPHPKGYDLAPGDLTLLDPVRRRPKLYREC